MRTYLRSIEAAQSTMMSMPMNGSNKNIIRTYPKLSHTMHCINCFPQPSSMLEGERISFPLWIGIRIIRSGACIPGACSVMQRVTYCRNVMRSTLSPSLTNEGLSQAQVETCTRYSPPANLLMDPEGTPLLACILRSRSQWSPTNSAQPIQALLKLKRKLIFQHSTQAQWQDQPYIFLYATKDAQTRTTSPSRL